MKKTFSLGIIMICVSFVSCQQSFVGDRNSRFQNSESGLEYKVYETGEKSTIKTGDAVVFHVLMANGDEVIRDTYKEGVPINMIVEDSPFKGSLEDGLIMLSEGDSATFLISADSLYAKSFHTPLPEDIKEGSKLQFDVKVTKVVTKSELAKGAEIDELKIKLLNEDQINQYLLKNKLFSAEKMPSGIYIVRKGKARGPNPEPGSRIAVHYIGKLLDGMIFDNSYVKEEPLVFTLGKGEVLKGWDIAIPYLGLGEKATIIIPSYLAYGEDGAGTMIPPNSPLAFDVEIVGIK